MDGRTDEPYHRNATNGKSIKVEDGRENDKREKPVSL